jgi:hypothetical protein
MKISAIFTFWMGIAFSLVSVAMALSNLTGADPDATEAQLADAHGFAMYWLFLAAFGIVMVVVSWLMMKGKLGGDQE